jgi:hypothetical protein
MGHALKMAGIALMLAACGGASMQSYQPTHKKTKHSADTLLEASTRAVEKLQHQIETRDAETHSLRTREREVSISNVPKLSYKYAFRISTSGGTLRIDSNCTENSSMNRTTFEDCGDKRPEKVVKEQAALEEKILEVADKMEEAPTF